jgi:hypothetical protein
MRVTAASLTMLVCTAGALADADGGISALRARLGSAAPTGSGVAVMQVEATESSGAYAPNPADAAFAGKTITRMDPAAGNSSHATTVGQALYGSGTSMASGVVNIWAYNVNSWITGTLKVGGGSTAPSAAPSTAVRVMNHSWIGSFGAGNAAFDREAVRRLDFQASRDGILAVCGENNGAGSARQPMMGDTFNGVSVGRNDLQHSAGDTPAASDTPGRMKPDLIAPGAFTSFSTPVVGAAAALLFETIQGSSLNSLSNLQKVQLAKVCLLGGADRDASWANNAPQTGSGRGVATKPIDAVRGAGSLNVDRAHRILTAARQDGASSVSAATFALAEGWGTAAITSTQKAYWRFNVNQLTPAFDFTLVWPRTVASNFGSYTHPDMNLRVYRALDNAATLVPMEGEAGADLFAAGNVQSASTVDNVETLHLVDLQPGEYVVELSRVGSGTAFTAYAAWMVDAAAYGRPGDLDGNGSVDAGDIGVLLVMFGTANPSGDLDRNGTVDAGDIAVLLVNFG